MLGLVLGLGLRLGYRVYCIGLGLGLRLGLGLELRVRVSCLGLGVRV